VTRMGDPSRSSQVPPINELRPIVQGAKSASDQRWSYQAFRRISLHVTWALLHTSVTPNQVTAASLVVAIVGLVLVAIPGAPAIAGCVLLLMYHLLDRVDGELARYQNRYSLLGVYLDNAGHYLTGGGLLIAGVYGLAPLSPDPDALWLVSSLAAIAAMMSRVEKHAAFHLFSQYVMDHPDLVNTVRHDAGPLSRAAVHDSRSYTSDNRSRRGPVSMTRDILLTLSWFPVSAVILMLGFIVDTITGWTQSAILALLVVATLQIVAYLGVEVANIAGNLGAETRRLAAEAGLLDQDDAS
jgi:hypothetical protein